MFRARAGTEAEWIVGNQRRMFITLPTEILSRSCNNDSTFFRTQTGAPDSGNLSSKVDMGTRKHTSREIGAR